MLGGLLLRVGFSFANHYERAPRLVVAVILATMVTVFTLCMLEVRYGWRSYRLRS